MTLEELAEHIVNHRPDKYEVMVILQMCVVKGEEGHTPNPRQATEAIYREAFKKHKGNGSAVARELGVSLATAYRYRRRLWL